MSEDSVLAPSPDDGDFDVFAVTGSGEEATDDQALTSQKMGAAELAQLAAVQAQLQKRQGETQVELRMDATQRACELLGDVHTAAPVIIITGTNGKTSTARMIDSLLTAHGLRTGRFSSPHLQYLTERFSLDGDPVSVDTLVRVYDDIEPILQIVDAELVENNRPALTYFEALTVLAYAIFADAPVDVNVIEVGMGGQWDSTNVADAQVCVFTPIGLDHMQHLGPDRAAIAATKAGILNRTVDPSPAPHPIAVVGKQAADATEVLTSKIAQHSAEGRWANSWFQVVERTRAVDGQVVYVRTQWGDYPDLFVPLHGAHQADNAAVAIAAVEAFLATEDTPLNPDNVGNGLSAVTSPGRVEIVRAEPTIIVDGAHNPDAAKVLAETVQDAFDFTEVVAVVAMYADKDPHGVLEHVHSFADRVVATEVMNNPRALPVADLAQAATEWWDPDDVVLAQNLNEAMMKAIDIALDAKDGTGGIVVTGSLSTVAEARILLGAKD